MGEVNAGIAALLHRLCVAIQNFAWELGVRHAAYVYRLEKNLRDLKKGVEDLRAVKEDMITKVTLEEKRAMLQKEEVGATVKRLSVFTLWVSRVDEETAKGDELLQEGERQLDRLCLGGICSANYLTCSVYGGKVAACLDELLELKKQDLSVVTGEAHVEAEASPDQKPKKEDRPTEVMEKLPEVRSEEKQNGPKNDVMSQEKDEKQEEDSSSLHEKEEEPKNEYSRPWKQQRVKGEETKSVDENNKQEPDQIGDRPHQKVNRKKRPAENEDMIAPDEIHQKPINKERVQKGYEEQEEPRSHKNEDRVSPNDDGLQKVYEKPKLQLHQREETKKEDRPPEVIQKKQEDKKEDGRSCNEKQEEPKNGYRPRKVYTTQHRVENEERKSVDENKQESQIGARPQKDNGKMRAAANEDMIAPKEKHQEHKNMVSLQKVYQEQKEVENEDTKPLNRDKQENKIEFGAERVNKKQQEVENEDKKSLYRNKQEPNIEFSPQEVNEQKHEAKPKKKGAINGDMISPDEKHQEPKSKDKSQKVYPKPQEVENGDTKSQNKQELTIENNSQKVNKAKQAVKNEYRMAPDAKQQESNNKDRPNKVTEKQKEVYNEDRKSLPENNKQALKPEDREQKVKGTKEKTKNEDRPRISPVKKQPEPEYDDMPQKQQQENQSLLIICLSQDLGFTELGMPIAACLVYKCLIQWRSFEDGRTSIFDRISETIGSAIEVKDNNDILSYWLSNTSMLLLLLQNTIKGEQRKSALGSVFGRISKGIRGSPQSSTEVHDDSKHYALLFQQQLLPYLEKTYGMIKNNLKRDISAVLGLFMPTQAPQKKSSATYFIMSHTVISPVKAFGREVAHWKIIVHVLNDFLKRMKANYVPPLLVRNVFAQTFSSINVQLFNSILLWSDCCSLSYGDYVKAGLDELDKWCKEATVEFAGSAWDELKHIRQAAGFLVTQEKPKMTLKMIEDCCPALSKKQLHKICSTFWDDKYGTSTVSVEVLSSLMVKKKEGSSNYKHDTPFLLDDNSSIAFTVDELSKSMPQVEAPDIYPPLLMRGNSGFSFLLQPSK